MKSAADQLRDMGFGDDQIARATVDGKPLAEADKPKPKVSDRWPGFRSKWEALYAQELEYRKQNGAILDWIYEGITLRVTDPVMVDGKRRPGVRYMADFAVWMPDGRLVLVEIKGHLREKDKLRYKMARDKFRHIEFTMVSRAKGSWVQLNV